MGTAFCCTLLVTCLPKVFHVGSAKFTTGDFECLVHQKRFNFKKTGTLGHLAENRNYPCQTETCGHLTLFPILRPVREC